MEIQACVAVDRNFVEGRPTVKYALKRLAPCMEGLSKIYGNKIYAESTIMNPDNLQIVVLDSVAGKTIVEDLEASLAKRDGRLYGHAVRLSVMDPEYIKKQEGETCNDRESARSAALSCAARLEAFLKIQAIEARVLKNLDMRYYFELKHLKARGGALPAGQREHP